MKKVLTKTTTYLTTGTRETIWFPCFSWLPRKVEGKWVWLKTIEKKMSSMCWFGRPMNSVVEYRLHIKLRTLIEPKFRAE